MHGTDLLVAIGGKSRVEVVVDRPEAGTSRRPVARHARRTSDHANSRLILPNDGHGRGGVITSSREIGAEVMFLPPTTRDIPVTAPRS